MKGYDSYKTINIDWLDKLPSQWKTIQIKQLNDGEDTLFIDGDWIESPVITDYGIRYLTTGNIGPGFYKEQGSGFINEETFEKLNCTEVFPGDLLISRLNEPIGRACIIPDLGYRIITAVDNVILRPKKPFNIRYLMHLMNSPEYSAFTSLISRGATMKRISRGLLGGIKIPFPSGEEQTAIASFLDYKTNLIDATIKKKKRLIALLKEKRQAVINEAVTKGLNPNATMKDSGVEWLGEIPEHWEVKKVKYLLNNENGIKIGPFGSALKLDTLSDKGIKVYGQGNVIKDDFNHGHRYIDIERFEKDFKQYEILNGDILITMMGTTGKSKVFNSSYEKGILDSHLLRLRFNENLFDGRLFSILLEQSDYVYQQLTINSVGSIMAGLNSSIVKELSIITPTLEIQKEILNYIDKNSKIIDSISSKILFQIEKLQTYRQSLISEAVTGKIDVRDWENAKN